MVDVIRAEADGLRVASVVGARESFLDGPGVASVAVAMAVRGEKAAAMIPEERPELFAIRQRERKVAQGGAGKNWKCPSACGAGMASRRGFTSKRNKSQWAWPW